LYVVLVVGQVAVSIRMDLFNDLPEPSFEPILIHVHTHTQHLIETPIPSFSLLREEPYEVVAQPTRNEKRKEKSVVASVGGCISARGGGDVECLVGEGEEVVGQ